MNPNREEALFAAALEQAPADRAVFLKGACLGDAALRQRVESLLAAHEQPETLLATQAETARPTIKLDLDDAPDEAVGQTLGRYKLLERVGEGGCGVVYVAEQTEPVRRRVALKVIKLGMDTKQVVARFEAERQALAMMDHPNIAKVLDAGSTETGRPYFVMELVRGIRITEYCDQNNLPTQDRLDLFIKVCQAIQHAHQKGIIHRDIKPSNILVTLHDGVPVPKVIDFGIAKATEGRLTDATVYTQLHQFIGTPAYMSPEQAEMSGLDIDTRSDIYSLGVLLYELLTGMTPFDATELMAQGIDAMRKTIREKDPLRPSTKLATLKGDELTTTAKRRSVEAAKLTKLLRGDLDWIVMKCLEKDRTRRYETANGVAMDLKRHLSNEPVAARPPSQVYKIQKFARRNKVAFAAAACVAVALVAGLGLATLGLVQARIQRKEALDAQANEGRQRQRADELGRQAEEQRQRAEEGKRRAEIGELAAQQRAYASDMNLVQQALAEGNLGRALEFLNQHRPQPGQPDLRGWEWRYLWQQTRSEAIATLCSDSGWIFSVAASADGRWLAIVDGHSYTLRLWDRAKGTVAYRLGIAGQGTAQTMFSPVNSFLAYPCNLATRTNDYEFGVRVWDPRRLRQIVEIPAGVVAGMAFSADERILLTCDYDRMVTHWQFPEGHKLSTNSFKTLPGFKSGGVQLTTTSDAGTVFLADYGGNRFAFDLKAGKELWSHREAADNSYSLKLSPDDRILAMGPRFTGGPIILLEAATGRELGRLEGHRNAVATMVFWPDGKRLASASYDQTIRVWDIRDPAHLPPPRILRGHKLEVWGLALLPDGKTLVSGSKDGEVCLWDTALPPREPPIAYYSVSNSPAWSFAPDSHSIIGVDVEARELVEWQGAGGPGQTTTIPLIAGAETECWSRDGRWLAVGATNGWVQVWEFPARILRVEFSTGTNPVVPLQFHQDNEKLALATGGHGERFEIWDLQPARQSLSRLIPAGFEFGVNSMNRRSFPFELAPDLSQIFVKVAADVPREQRFFLWTPSNDQRLQLEIPDEVEVVGVAFSPDTRLVAATSISGLTRVWDVRTGTILAQLTGFLNASAGVTFSLDSRRLAVGGGGDGALKLWDVATWRELVTLRTDGDWVSRLRFSPDGNGIGAEVGSILQTWRAPSWTETAAAEANKQAQSKQP